MVSKQKPKQKQRGAKRIFAAIAIIAAALFILAAAAPAAAPESSMQPAASVSNYTPAPTMNTNVSWSSFNTKWQPLEYSNGTANLTLNADMSTFYKNPISLNPSDLILNGTLQNDKVAGTVWNTAAVSNGNTAPAGGATYSTGYTTIGNVKEPYISENASKAASNTIWLDIPQIYITNLPSNNLQYDYFTFGAIATGTAETGFSMTINIANQSSNSPINKIAIPLNTPFYFSLNIAQIQKMIPQIGFNLSGKGATSFIQIQPTLFLPISASTSEYTIQVFAYALTTYPILLGQNSTGQSPDFITGNAALTALSSSLNGTVYNNGYSVAVSQPMQNITEQQTSINDGSYTEQATYQGIFSLPSAPNLQYSASNITVPLTIAGTQYEVANLNGASYLSSIQTQANGTFSFGTVNPNAQNSLVLEVKYTTSQWDTSSGAPSFFTLAGIEYYWWVAVLGVMGLIGLGSLAISHFGGTEENLRIPKGKYGR